MNITNRPKQYLGQESSSSGASVALSQGRELLSAARAEAAQILKLARTQAEELRHQAYQAGYDEGLNRALAQLFDLAQARVELANETKAELLKISIAVAEEVVGDALQLQPESICCRIDRALGEAFNEGAIVVVVNPEDRALVEENLSVLSRSRDRQLPLTVEHDSSIPRGDAKLISSSGTLTACLSTHLSAIKQKILSR